jgi:hypothetical protein
MRAWTKSPVNSRRNSNCIRLRRAGATSNRGSGPWCMTTQRLRRHCLARVVPTKSPRLRNWRAGQIRQWSGLLTISCPKLLLKELSGQCRRRWSWNNARLDDICSGTNVRRRATIVQKKTGRPVQFEISEQSRNSVEALLPMLRTNGSRYLFPSRLHASPHISIRICSAGASLVKGIGLDSASYGTHSMRRTNAA